MPGPSEAKIVFSPSGKWGKFPVGTPVLQAARELGEREASHFAHRVRD